MNHVNLGLKNLYITLLLQKVLNINREKLNQNTSKRQQSQLITLLCNTKYVLTLSTR